ncbi:Enolase [bioreactor metagenome]|uniref:phosphopyruvate hydratase n=1 Tax=bioreactor metagenome TaxID=1076179 RepID=A0A645EBV2_9ZZZZ
MPEAKQQLGGNAVAAVSAAVLKAGANALGIPLYRHIGGNAAMHLPVPGVAMVAGDKRYGGGITTPGGKPTMSVMCFGFDTFSDASYACWEIHTRWAEKMKKLFGGSPNIRDFIVVPEGCFNSDEHIWEAMVKTIAEAGYEGKAGLQMDVATDTYYNKEDEKYYGLFNREVKTKDQLFDFYLHIINEFPFVIIEDPFNEDDYEATAELTKQSGIQIVGDDLFTTNIKRVEYGISKGAANTVLLKVNQIGTISEALQMIEHAYKFGYAVMPSDSRGEGESIADYAVGINAGSIRECGIGQRANRFLEIEEELGPSAKFLGARGLKGFKNQQLADAHERRGE